MFVEVDELFKPNQLTEFQREKRIFSVFELFTRVVLERTSFFREKKLNNNNKRNLVYVLPFLLRSSFAGLCSRSSL